MCQCEVEIYCIVYLLHGVFNMHVVETDIPHRIHPVVVGPTISSRAEDRLLVAAAAEAAGV